MNSLERTKARLQGKAVDRLPAQPLFMIYAADLIGVKYSDYLQDYRLLVEGQMAVADKFPIDLVSCCSDAWREAADCGAEMVWADNLPPHAARPLIQEPADLAKLKMPDPLGGGRMTDRVQAVRLFAEQVGGRIPILGWIEGPIAQASDLLGMDNLMMATFDDTQFVRDVMDWIVEMETRFALAQVEAGADMIGLGDAAASLVSPAFYESEVAPREKKIIDAIHEAGATVRMHICGDIHRKFEAMAATGADLFDIDYAQTIAEVRAAVGPDACLAGNLDPVEDLLRSNAERIKAGFARCREQAGEKYILAVGCEVPPGTPEENIRAMFDYALSSV